MMYAEREELAVPDGDDASQQSPSLTSVLVVDDEPGIRSFVQKGLEKYFGLVEVAGDANTADALRQRCHFDLIIADIRGGMGDRITGTG